jgi:NADPH2:quinone reductase
VYDGIGKTTFDESLSSLRPRGLLAVFGRASGPAPAVETGRLFAGGSLYLTSPSLMYYTATRDELLERSRDVFRWIEEGTLDVHIGGRYPLGEAATAQADLASRSTTGKLLLLPG